jgi:hypothetical protein
MESTMLAGLICRGQGVRFENRFVVRFRDGEELVSVLELLPATQITDYVSETDPEIEEEEQVFGEAADEASVQDLAVVFDRGAELEDGDEDVEEEAEEEMAEEME